jgi:hypothetical protein
MRLPSFVLFRGRIQIAQPVQDWFDEILFSEHFGGLLNAGSWKRGWVMKNLRQLASFV